MPCTLTGQVATNGRLQIRPLPSQHPVVLSSQRGGTPGTGAASAIPVISWHRYCGYHVWWL